MSKGDWSVAWLLVLGGVLMLSGCASLKPDGGVDAWLSSDSREHLGVLLDAYQREMVPWECEAVKECRESSGDWKTVFVEYDGSYSHLLGVEE